MTSNALSYEEGDKGEEVTTAFAKTKEIPIRFLEFRDMPELISKYLGTGAGQRALDFGTGVGFSLVFMHQQLGGRFELHGADIDATMLASSQERCPFVSQFHLVRDGKLPYEDASFDLIVSSFVVFEMAQREQIAAYFAEARRILKPRGIFVVATGSEEMHNPERLWCELDVEFPENHCRAPGSPVKSHPVGTEVIFRDYFWREFDYRSISEEQGLRVAETHFPLGNKGEAYLWLDELTISPLMILILQHQ